MRTFRGDYQDSRSERRRDSEASDRFRIVNRREACSPRAAVAFSALSAVTWLREIGADIVGRITGRWNATVRPKVAVEARKQITPDVQGN
jgi:hypothetical protein